MLRVENDLVLRVLDLTLRTNKIYLSQILERFDQSNHEVNFGKTLILQKNLLHRSDTVYRYSLVSISYQSVLRRLH